jgi:threonine efflux protein
MLPLATAFALHWAVLLTPGPNALLIAQLAASGHARAARAASVGIASVALTWATLAALGVGAVFAAHPALRTTLQAAGGAYLLWIAAKLWRASRSANQPTATQGTLTAFTTAQAFRLGLVTNLGNPKTALFFGSVFATSLPAEPTSALLAAAIALMTANSLAWHLLLSWAFSHARVQRAYARQQGLLHALASAVLAVFGGRLLLRAVTDNAD